MPFQGMIPGTAGDVRPKAYANPIREDYEPFHRAERAVPLPFVEELSPQVIEGFEPFHHADAWSPSPFRGGNGALSKLLQPYLPPMD